MPLVYDHTWGSPIPAALSTSSLGWDPKQSRATVTNCPRQRTSVSLTRHDSLLGSLEATSPFHQDQEEAMGPPTPRWEMPWQWQVQVCHPSPPAPGDIEGHILTQTPSFLAECPLPQASWPVGLSHVWTNAVLGCKHGGPARRDVEITRWVT